MWEIARDSQVLDTNSPYAYTLWATEFSATSLIAEWDGEVRGFVTGFIRPADPTRVFVWQIAVDAALRGRRVGHRLLGELLDRLATTGVTGLATTISPDNVASQKLFAACARERGLRLDRSEYMPAELFPDAHEPEDLYLLGPAAADPPAAPAAPASPAASAAPMPPQAD